MSLFNNSYDRSAYRYDRYERRPQQPILTDEIFRPCRQCERWTSTHPDAPESRCNMSSSSSSNSSTCIPEARKDNGPIYRCLYCNRCLAQNEKIRCPFNEYLEFCVRGDERVDCVIQ